MNIVTHMAGWGLPTDIFLIIFGRYLSVGDIMNVRRTCRFFFSITQLRTLWHTLLHTHVLEKNIPIPGLTDRPIDSLSAGEIERLTHSAMRLRRNWSSPSPVATQQIELPGLESKSRIVALEFLSGRGYHLILSVELVLSSPSRTFTVSCWDVGVSPPARVAKRQLVSFGSLAVNTDRANPAIIVVQCPHNEIWGIDFAATHPDSAFVTLGVFQTRFGEPRVFSGSRILAQEGDLRCVLWDVNNPDHGAELWNSDDSERERLLAAIITEEVVIVFGIHLVEIYSLASLCVNMAAGTVTHPVAQHKWPWRIHSICVTEQACQTEAPGRLRRAISALVRFGSWYPWPANVLHHYMLHPDQSYVPSIGINANNIPYSTYPIIAQFIGSPVRLSAPSPMTLGLYGTAVWIDSHTEDYFGHGDHGQRLAGRILMAAGSRSDNDDADADPFAPIKSSHDQMASIVFCVGEHNDWIRLAVDEEEGRLAIGGVTGSITILDYA